LKASITTISGREGREMPRTKINIQRKEGEKEDVPNHSWNWESKVRFIKIQGRAGQRRRKERRGEVQATMVSAAAGPILPDVPSY
jgi:hypothetical protein